MSRNFTRWAKTRLSAEEYSGLAARADRAGHTISAYLRELITRQHGEFQLREVLRDLDSRLRELTVARTVAADVEPLLVEAVLLGREQLARRDAQALAQVRAQLDARFPGRRAV
jgi:hypothetical protein